MGDAPRRNYESIIEPRRATPITTNHGPRGDLTSDEARLHALSPEPASAVAPARWAAGARAGEAGTRELSGEAPGAGYTRTGGAATGTAWICGGLGGPRYMYESFSFYRIHADFTKQ